MAGGEVAQPDKAVVPLLRMREKMDPVLAKVMGSEEQRKDMAVKRLDVREILGTKTMREIMLK